MWRTGSTYVWHKYRQTGLCHCYLEPLHEEMLVLDPARNRARFLAGEPSLLRHPDLSEPCFAEYPVRPGGGVPGYLKRFAYERYVLEGDDQDVELESYIAGLRAWAEDRGRIGVFQPNHALLRSEWICRRFGSFHIFLVRHPWDVWRSMTSYPNLYFPGAILNTISHNRESPYFTAFLASRSAQRDLTCSSLTSGKRCSSWRGGRCGWIRWTRSGTSRKKPRPAKGRGLGCQRAETASTTLKSSTSWRVRTLSSRRKKSFKSACGWTFFHRSPIGMPRTAEFQSGYTSTVPAL